MVYGYSGKILHVNLNELSWEIETPDDSFYRKYLGGGAMSAYYLLKNSPKKVDAFSPDNMIIFSLGLIAGIPISGNSRVTVTAKSPLTDGIGDAQAGGFFPAEMKFSGFDAVVVSGKAPHPGYLWLKDGEVELRSAEHLWGKGTAEVEDIIREELDDNKIEVMQTGPAGERLVRYAAVINNANRAAGRTGMGAVMGSKNFKAIAVRGKQKPNLYDLEKVKEIIKWGIDAFPESNSQGLGLYGTAGGVKWLNKSGSLPTRNWESGAFDGVEGLDGVQMTKDYLVRRGTCHACVIRCKREIEITEGPYKVDPRYGGPEYETVASFGSYCGVDSIEAVSLANELCNKYGLDTISCGATIAWAMDCYEQGLLSKEDLDGIDLKFGNAEGMIQMIEKIAVRDGIGDLLAEGSYRAAEEMNRGTMDLVVTAKKQEFPAHTPRVKRSLGLIYAVNPFGADHQSADQDPSWKNGVERLKYLGFDEEPQDKDDLSESKVRFMLTTQNWYSMQDSINVCHFVFGPTWPLYGPEEMVNLVNAVTGWGMDAEELSKIGQRRIQLMNAFNVREGLRPEDDKLPKKMYQAMVGGKTDGNKYSEDDFERVKKYYYELVGWDEKTGVPSAEVLEGLGLGWVAEVVN